MFIFGLFTSILFGTDISSQPDAETIFIVMEVLILGLFAAITFSFYRTKYQIRGGEFFSWSPFAVIRFKLSDVRKVERMIVPVHVRVGASFYSGIFYIPSVGWTKSIITNLSDGLLIWTRGGKTYLITPSNPDRFARALKRR